MLGGKNNMAYTPLSTDFKDQILSEVNTQRKYKQTVNEDGTVSLQDMTAYDQEGSAYTAKHIIEERKAINDIYANRVVSLKEASLVTEPGFFCDALVINELNKNIIKNTDEQQIYTLYGGLVKVVSGTMVVNVAMNIGYAKLFSVEQLKNWFGDDYTASRLSVKTYNGDSVAQEVHFYAPEIWNGEIFQYFYPTNHEGGMRVNYRLEYVYPST